MGKVHIFIHNARQKKTNIYSNIVNEPPQDLGVVCHDLQLYSKSLTNQSPM